jgi:hypothetical protein
MTDNLKLAAWPSQYRAAPSSKYYGESDPRKFLMCYEATIASSGGDDTTLTKLFIITLENAAANWYTRLPPRSIALWAQLKEKFLVNFQGFHGDLSMEEDFFSCQQYERETPPNYFRRFFHLGVQALEVSDEQAITQARKAMHAGQLHNHLVRERLRILEELYDNFRKFSRSEVLHFRKLGQQRKTVNENEGSRPAKYNKSKESTLIFDTSYMQVHNIDLDGCGPPKNYERNFKTPWPQRENITYDTKRDYYHARGDYSSRGRGRGQNQDRPLYCMFHERDTDHRTRDCPILEYKKKMAQKHNQAPNPTIAKEVNHTSHWHQASQSSLSHQPSYLHSSTRSGYQSNYHKYPSPYYQLYNYTLHTTQAHSSQPTITYPPPPPPPLQITYLTTNSQTVEPKPEPNTLPPPPQTIESSQQNTNFLT